MTSLRLLADDLTGALDTAAELVGITGPVQVFWHGAIPPGLPANVAVDSGTRELPAAQAAGIVAGLAGLMTGGAIAYKKIDSLLRGPTLAELAACMRAGPWRHCVLAPAFPYQGRATRGGRQYARDAAGHWSAVSPDIVAALQAEGVAAFPGQLDEPVPPGIGVFDAETDEDLRRVVATARRAPGPVLWSGSGGLAQALADGAEAACVSALPRPILGLFGSDQGATATQLAACGAYWVRLPEPHAARGARGAPLARLLHAAGAALVSFDLPPGLARDDAAERIRAGMCGLLHDLERPGTLLAAGGETLRGICIALGAHSLEVQGRLLPGLPRSVLRGGRWDGVTVVSKSGAFGAATLLRDLLRRHLATDDITSERTD